MKIPLWILMYLPKSFREKQIQKRWDSMSDEEILDSYMDAMKWIKLINKPPFEGEGLFKNITVDCEMRLNKYIKPQIKKRGIDTSQVDAQSPLQLGCSKSKAA